jgi:adenine-specific DNA-methyltransferase
LPPILRFGTSATDELPELLKKAQQAPLTADEAKILASALRKHEPWLEWSGKREKKWFEIEPVALHIHERISTKAILKVLEREDVQRELFADPQQGYAQAVQFYQHDVDWSNRMILGDSLQVMASLAKREDLAGKVQMIYIDPPYGIKFASNFQPQLGQRDVKDREQDLTREPEMVKAYRDTWQLGIHSYIAYLRDRLIIARNLLSESGNVFVQISDENVHIVRFLLDEVFGRQNFLSQINFRTAMTKPTSGLNNVFDYVLWFAKDKGNHKYRDLFVPKETDDGISQHQLQSSAKQAIYSFTFNGTVYNPDNGWRVPQNGLERLARAERVYQAGKTESKTGTLKFIRYEKDFLFNQLDNTWNQQSSEQNKDYVVQTSTKIIERCLLMTTDPGDLVLDPTCGSGTTAYVAEQWGRRWITCDTSRVALALARQRLMTARFQSYALRDLNPDDLNRNPNGSWLIDPTGIIKGKATLQCKEVSHITLKSIARNASLDPIFVKHESILSKKLKVLNSAVQKIGPQLRSQLTSKLQEKQKREGKKSITDADRRRWQLPKKEWKEWEVPFDTDPDWPQELHDALMEYSRAWRSKMDEVNDCIAKNTDMEELVDKPEPINGVVRVSGPFSMESVIAMEQGIQSPIGGEPEDELETFDGEMESVNAEANIDKIIRLLKVAGVDFKDNKNMKFKSLEPLATSTLLHAEGEWINGDKKERKVAVSIGPEVGNIASYQVEEAVRAANRRNYDDIVFAGFGFDAAAQAAIEEASHPNLRLHMALIRPDVVMGDLLKTQPGSQLFTVFSAPRVKPPKKVEDDMYVIEVEGMDVYDPVTNTLHPTSTDKIAAWFLDSDYDGRTFCICQAFFPDKSKWARLAKALGDRGIIDEEKFETLSGLKSLPFPKGKFGRIAVKVIDPRGNEGLRVIKL